MMKTTFYHAGCPMCVSAGQAILTLADPLKFLTEVVHLGTEKKRIVQAETLGVRSVPALVLSDSEVLSINFGAALHDIKN